MSPRSALTRVALATALVGVPALAFAHTGHGALGVAHGFAHPIGGIDHMLAMVAVGIFAASLGGRPLWAAPLTFMALMAAGGALGISGMPLPFVEIGIALSIIVLGLVVAVRCEWRLRRQCRWSVSSQSFTVTRTGPRCRPVRLALPTLWASCWRPDCCISWVSRSVSASAEPANDTPTASGRQAASGWRSLEFWCSAGSSDPRFTKYFFVYLSVSVQTPILPLAEP